MDHPVDDTPFTESDFNLARGCQDLGAVEDDDDTSSSDINLVRGGQDTNAIMETKSRAMFSK